MPFSQHFLSFLLFQFRGFRETEFICLAILSIPLTSTCLFSSWSLWNLFWLLAVLNIHFWGNYWELNKFSWNYLRCQDLISERWGSAQCQSLSMYSYNYFNWGLAVHIYLCRISLSFYCLVTCLTRSLSSSSPLSLLFTSSGSNLENDSAWLAYLLRHLKKVEWG